MRRRRGFTVVEVMVSLGVMTIGAMALIGMEQQTTRANILARQTTIATQIAQNWIERLKMDGVRWSTVTTNPANDLALTNYLIGITVAQQEGRFVTLVPASNSGHSNSFDYYGNDIIAGAGNTPPTYYCASYRLTWVYPRQLMRADVRVFWPREGTDAPGNFSTSFPGCAEPASGVSISPGGASSLVDRYHAVYLSTAIRNMQVN